MPSWDAYWAWTNEPLEDLQLRRYDPVIVDEMGISVMADNLRDALTLAIAVEIAVSIGHVDVSFDEILGGGADETDDTQN